MSVRPNPDHTIAGWLRDEAVAGAPDRLIEAVRAELESTNQRRPWGPAWRVREMNTALRYAISAAAAVAVVAVVGVFLFPRPTGVGTIPSTGASASPSIPGAVAPSVSPTTTAFREGSLTAGRYVVYPYDTTAPSLAITLTVPDGWSGFANWGLISPKGPEAPNGIAIGLLSASELFSDPCHWDIKGDRTFPQPGDVAVGPKAVDLANAIDRQFGASSTAPAAVSLAGFPGYRLDVQLPDVNFATACDKASGQTEGSYFVWSTREASGNDLFAQGPAQRWHLWILDVAGKRIIVVMDDFAGTSAEDRAAAQAIVDSISIQP